MDNIVEETRFIMKKYQIKANKSLGQNFLISQEVVNAIVDSSEITKEDLVIEIGPGLGTLTKELLEQAGKVVCIELDPKMVTILKDRFGLYDNFELLHEDVLKVELKKLIAKQKEINHCTNAKIVANLPYYITTPIIMKLLEEELDLDSITVMIQKEVADRLIATPGDKNTGAITYAVYYYAKSKPVMIVPNDSFIPEPEVTSEVIQLKIRKEKFLEIENKKVLFKIIKCAFMQRRKTLLNSLVNAQIFETKQEGTTLLKSLDINPGIRPEKLTIEEFVKIANAIDK